MDAVKPILKSQQWNRKHLRSIREHSFGFVRALAAFDNVMGVVHLGLLQTQEFTAARRRYRLARSR